MRAALEASMRRSRAGASTRRDADAVAAEVVKRRQDEESQPAADGAGGLTCTICQCQGCDTKGLRPTQQVVSQHQSELHDMSVSGRDFVGEPSVLVAAGGRPDWQGNPAYHAESLTSSLCGMGPHSPPLVPMLTAARAPACD